jgi:hypothetical protein
MLLVGALAVPAVLSVMPSATPAQSASFRSSPAAGPAGTGISLASITPCRSPVAGRPIVQVSLVRAFHQPGRVLASATFQTSASGSWSGTLRVPAVTPGGGEEAGVLASLTAVCRASPQAEGALLIYNSRDFTITPTARAPAAAPVTAPARFTG